MLLKISIKSYVSILTACLRNGFINIHMNDKDRVKLNMKIQNKLIYVYTSNFLILAIFLSFHLSKFPFSRLL